MKKPPVLCKVLGRDPVSSTHEVPTLFCSLQVMLSKKLPAPPKCPSKWSVDLLFGIEAIVMPSEALVLEYFDRV